MNICTKFGFDILIISGSYGGHRRHTTYDGRRTTPRVWHKLPTGELIIILYSNELQEINISELCLINFVVVLVKQNLSL